MQTIQMDEYDFVSQFYDSVDPYRNRKDVGFFVDAAKESKGPILEVGCGTGRILIPTAREGLKITGLDLSTAMLAQCREKLAKEPWQLQERAVLIQADMRHFDLSESFGLITIPFRPFQHLVSVEDQIACLTCIHRHLALEGTFILDLFNPSIPGLAKEDYQTENADTEFKMPDGRRVIRKSRVAARDLWHQVQDIELIYYVTHPDGREERLVHAFPMRYLFRYEVEHLLARTGFTVEHIYSDYDKSPYGSKYPGELIVVARKR